MREDRFRWEHTEAPLSILALELIAIRACLTETGKVALARLSLVNNGSDDLPETGIAKRRADIVGAPGNQ